MLALFSKVEGGIKITMASKVVAPNRSQVVQSLLPPVQTIKISSIMDRKVRKLNDSEEVELDTLLISGLELLPIQQQNEERFVLLAVHLLLEAIRMGEPLPQNIDHDDFCAQMGVVYGEQICMLLHWDWVYLTLGNSYEGAAVMNPERTKALFPIPTIHRWTQQQNTNRCLVLFEELESSHEEHTFSIVH